jgi:hypothetical protein
VVDLEGTIGAFVVAELKTKPNDASVEAFLASIEDAEKQKDARALLRLMQRAAGQKPKMWGTNMVGFGHYHYRYASGREGDWFVTGFSPRAQNLTIYIMAGFAKLKTKLAKLGKHGTGSSCLYVRRLADIDVDVLASILAQAVKEANTGGPTSKTSAPTTKAPGAKAKAPGAKRKTSAASRV